MANSFALVLTQKIKYYMPSYLKSFNSLCSTILVSSYTQSLTFSEIIEICILYQGFELYRLCIMYLKVFYLKNAKQCQIWASTHIDTLYIYFSYLFKQI